MRKFFSVGLLVILAAVLVFAGCASSPQAGDSQKIITITGIDPRFNEKYASVSFEENNATVAVSLPGQILNGSVTLKLLDAAATELPFTKNGSYRVGVLIFDSIGNYSQNIIWKGGISNINAATIPFSSLQQVN